MLFSKRRKININKKSRSFKRIKSGGTVIMPSNDNPLYVVYIYYKQKYWPILISLYNIQGHVNYKYGAENIYMYLLRLKFGRIMEETIFGNYIKDNTYLAILKINIKDDDITIIEHIMDKVNYENYLPLVEISTKKYNKKYIEDDLLQKQIIKQPIITRNFYKLIQNTDGIIKDIFTTFILSSSIKNKPIFKNFVGNMSSSEADVSEDSAIDTHMQKIFDSNVFEDGIENAIIVDYLNKNVSIIES